MPFFPPTQAGTLTNKEAHALVAACIAGSDGARDLKIEPDADLRSNPADLRFNPDVTAHLNTIQMSRNIQYPRVSMAACIAGSEGTILIISSN